MQREEIINKLERVLRCLYDEEGIEGRSALIGFYVSEYGKVCDYDSDLCRKLAEEFADDDNGGRKEDLLMLILAVAPFRYDELGLRICTHCGKTMDEGYILGAEYACSYECAVKVYMKDNTSEEEAKRLLDNDLEYDEENCVGEVYYTDWK